MQCSIYDKKGDIYEPCMLRVNRKFGTPMKDFCREHYLLSDVFTEDEKEEVEYFESYHTCLQEAGTKKGKMYCEDIIGAN